MRVLATVSDVLFLAPKMATVQSKVVLSNGRPNQLKAPESTLICTCLLDLPVLTKH